MIVDMFYSIGAYEDEEDMDPSYVNPTTLTDVYIPIAVQMLQSLLGNTKNIVVTENGDDLSSGDLFDDRIIALFAVSLADQDYDKIHIDPETGDKRNYQYDQAYQLFLMRYGVKIDGEVVPPSQAQSEYAATSILKVEMDY